MCSAMNSPNSDNVHNNQKNPTAANLFINDQLITQSVNKFETDDIPYLSEQFDSIVDEKDNNNYAHIKMDTNDNDDLNNALNSWTTGVGGGGGDTTEDDIGFQDDNVSHVGSDYSEFQPADQDNLFAQPNPPPDNYGLGGGGGELLEPDIKYSPSELMLRPPSGSAMHFNYNFPAMPSQNEPPSNIGPPPPNIHRSSNLNNNSQMPYLYGGNQTNMGSSSSAAAGTSAGSSYSTNSHTNPAYFHPNMWYPNAPFGTYRSYGSHAYGRHYGHQLSHDHMMDMFQLSNR